MTADSLEAKASATAELAHAVYREVMCGVSLSGNPIPPWAEEHPSVKRAWLQAARSIEVARIVGPVQPR